MFCGNVLGDPDDRRDADDVGRADHLLAVLGAHRAVLGVDDDEVDAGVAADLDHGRRVEVDERAEAPAARP